MDLLELGNEASEGKLIEEAFAELTGESKRRWAFLVIALLLGGSIAIALLRLKAARAQKEADTHEPQTVVSRVPERVT